MIPSILDNDLYKFTMQQAVMKFYPNAMVRYRFTDRDNLLYPEGFADLLEERVATMKDLVLQEEEHRFLKRRCLYLQPDYLEFLAHYRFDPTEVLLGQKHGRLEVAIQGPWVRTILWEVPLLAMISELYFQVAGQAGEEESVRRAKAEAKARELAANNMAFSEFGTRRRFSLANQELVVDALKACGGKSFSGTSNVRLAQLYDLAPIGTMAHEWIMFQGAMHGYAGANATALSKWRELYGDSLSIALSDTYTTDAFLREFTGELARGYRGVRQDSGNPVEFAEKMIKHYEALGMNPGAKTIVFSDSLNVERAKEIHRACRGRINDAYGIGTNLTNDVGVKPLNIVIKLFQAKEEPAAAWQDAVKLSDDRGKHMGADQEVRRCFATIQTISPDVDVPEEETI